MIREHSEKYAVTQICEFYKVSRSGYYDWLKRKENNKDNDLAEKIEECQRRHKKRYGYRRVVIWLERECGMIVNHKRVLRVMNKHNLLSEIRRKNTYSRMRVAELKHPNILERDFKAEAPNEKWCTDISYIQTKEGTLYLSVIKDLYDNYIVGYAKSRNQDYGLVEKTLKEARKTTSETAGVILHSDQGFQYTSRNYQTQTNEYGIRVSMSRAGEPLDNACAENFFGILKSECVYREKLETFEYAEELIDEYIEYYNYHRLQTKCKHTPYEWRTLAGNVS